MMSEAIWDKVTQIVICNSRVYRCQVKKENQEDTWSKKTGGNYSVQGELEVVVYIKFD